MKAIIHLQALIDGDYRALFLCVDGTLIPYYNRDGYDRYTGGSYYVLPTAADPLHKGHLHMANYVKSIREFNNTDVEFELSVHNVDKDDLNAEEVYTRLQQFMHLGRTCWITKFSTFVQKAHFFQECQFIIGTDTANRIVDPVYYFDCEGERDRVMSDIFAKGCGFIVLGRPEYILLPEVIKRKDLFFLEDYSGYNVSSTEIRETNTKVVFKNLGENYV